MKGGVDSVAGQGTKIPHATWCGKKITQKTNKKKMEVS